MITTLRPSRADDIDWLVELRASVLRGDLERLGRYDPIRVRERMRRAFVPRQTRVIVVDGADAGCITVRQTGDARWVEHFYIGADAQRRGIGGSVLRTVLAEPSPVPTRLNVLQGSAARRLYERNGFVVDEEDDVDVFMTHRPASR